MLNLDTALGKGLFPNTKLDQLGVFFFCGRHIQKSGNNSAFFNILFPFCGFTPDTPFQRWPLQSSLIRLPIFSPFHLVSKGRPPTFARGIYSKDMETHFSLSDRTCMNINFVSENLEIKKPMLSGILIIPSSRYRTRNVTREKIIKQAGHIKEKTGKLSSFF